MNACIVLLLESVMPVVSDSNNARCGLTPISRYTVGERKKDVGKLDGIESSSAEYL